VVGDEGGDLLVQVLLPVHALGNGLDDQVATTQLFQPGLVVGRGNRFGQRLAGQGSRAQLAQVGDGFEYHTVGRTFLCGQVEQHRVHPCVGEVRGNLGTHYAGPEHRYFTYKQLVRHVL